jgi:hypothetical protein
MDELSNKLLLLTRNKWWPATLASLLVARYSRETVGGSHSGRGGVPWRDSNLSSSSSIRNRTLTT